MLKIEPLALRLNLDRDFPEDLTAHLVHVIVLYSCSI